MRYSYYPGCSLHSTGKEFGQSVRAVFDCLGVDLQELEDWNCCGASSAHTLDLELSLALPARNLAIAQTAGLDVVMPCAACFNRHKAADHELRRGDGWRTRLEQKVGFTFRGSISVRPVLDVVCHDVGLEVVRAHVRKPLRGLDVVAYYGCLLVRPAEVTAFENPDNPVLMGELLEALGATVHSWSYATECCGGGLALTKPKVAAKLVERLADRAKEAGGRAIVTSCPLCQANLEMRQGSRVARIPIFYFTELMGLAFGLEQSASWWPQHLVNPKPLLHEAGLMD